MYNSNRCENIGNWIWRLREKVPFKAKEYWRGLEGAYMSYTALYRKWRPDTFKDVKGQGHIVTTLTNQIKSNRVGHAYLFCGTRGTGKTTVAKILAKAVNCESPVNGNPCGECEICKAISNGSSLNVIEIDAASNNGVDNIRQIREEVAYRPTEGKYKVYIIDEVHMLSSGAFNALLKTLEEPPAYVIFILATTEAHKIPVTIMSRCQKYDFKRISVEVITERLQELTIAENAVVEDSALRYIAKMADGAMRDALSLLDQSMAFYIDGKLRYEDVLEILGTVDIEVFSEMLRMIINGNVTECIKKLQEIILQGRDLSQFVADFTWYLRNLLLMKTSPESEEMLDMSAENIQKLREEVYMVDENTIIRYIKILSELSASLKFSTQKRIQVEVALIKLTRPQMEIDINSITERLKRLEALVKEKEDILALSLIRDNQPSQKKYSENPTINKPVKATIKALPEDLKQVASNWRGVVSQIEPMYKSYLEMSKLTVINNELVIMTSSDFIYKFLNREEFINSVTSIIEGVIGKKVELKVQCLGENIEFEDAFTDVEEYVKMDIKVEE